MYTMETGTIYCIGRNYSAHARELGNNVPDKPLIFLKNSSCAQDFDRSKVLWNQDVVHYEAEVVLRIGRDKKLGEHCEGKDISHFTLGLDLTKRHIQDHIKKEGLPWFAAKCFAGSALICPMQELRSEQALENLAFEMHLNDKVVQIGQTKDMIFNPIQILNYLNQIVELRKNDLIFTGTPEGVGPLARGDKVQLCFTNYPGSWEATMD